MGFPAFKTVCIYYFRRSDVQMLAKIVHGDVEKHIRQKEAERKERSDRARTKRVRGFKIDYHQTQLEVSAETAAERHLNSMSGPSLVNMVAVLIVSKD